MTTAKKMMPKVAKQTHAAKHSTFYFCSTFLKMALRKGSSPRTISNSHVSLSTLDTFKGKTCSLGLRILII